MALSERPYFTKGLKEAMSHADMATGRRNIPHVGNSQFQGLQVAAYRSVRGSRRKPVWLSGVRGGVADEVNEVEGRGKTWLDKAGTWRPLLGLGIFCLERIPMQDHLH